METQLLAKGHTLFVKGRTGGVWQIQSGLIWLSADHDQPLTWLALPGDYLGVESLCGEPYATTAVALKGSQLIAANATCQFSQFNLVAQGYLQQQQRLRDMARLRTGKVSVRLRHLLSMLAQQADGSQRALLRHELPTLREMAQLIDAKPETICRELVAFFPAPHEPDARAPSLTRLDAGWLNPV